MTDKLYPTTTSAQAKKWSRHIRKSLTVVNEPECAAHATLYDDPPIDFYHYDEENTKCYLGDLAHVTGPVVDSEETSEVRLRQPNVLDHTNTIYNEQWELMANEWNRYIFEVIDLADNEDVSHCGAKCELHSTGCDFFALKDSKCYFGTYADDQKEVVNVDSNIQTYHIQGRNVFKISLKLRRDFLTLPYCHF